MEDNNKRNRNRKAEEDAMRKVEEIARQREQATAIQRGDFFKYKTAAEWIDEAKLKPIPKKLFGELFMQSDLCILFSGTNIGKSILAVQIANQISSGISTAPIESDCRQPVLYFDFELSDKQFEARYSNDYKDHYKFNDWFIRVEINHDIDPPGGSFEDHLIAEMERLIEMTGATVLIVDNISYLKGEGLEKSATATALMKRLKALKAKHNLSILVIAHTPKRDPSSPITMNDLQGSSSLGNFIDSAFSIGQSNQVENQRYIKQLKSRWVEKRYEKNVLLCELIKTNGNFLEFRYIGIEPETRLLKTQTEAEKEDMEYYEVMEMKRKGMSLRQIAEELAVSHMKVKRILSRIPGSTPQRGEDLPF